MVNRPPTRETSRGYTVPRIHLFVILNNIERRLIGERRRRVDGLLHAREQVTLGIIGHRGHSAVGPRDLRGIPLGIARDDGHPVQLRTVKLLRLPTEVELKAGVGQPSQAYSQFHSRDFHCLFGRMALSLNQPLLSEPEPFPFRHESHSRISPYHERHE